MPNFKRMYSSFRNSIRHKKVDHQSLTESVQDEEHIRPQPIPFLRRKMKQNSSDDDGYCSARTSLYSSTLTSPSTRTSPTSSSNLSSNKSELSLMSTKKSLSSSLASISPLSPSVISPSLSLNDSMHNSILSPVTSVNTSLRSRISSLNASSYEDTIYRSSTSSASSTCSFKKKDNSYKKIDRIVRSSSELLEDDVFADIIEQLEDLDESELCQTQYDEKINKGNYEEIKEALDNEKNISESSDSSNSSMKQLLSRRLRRLTALLRLFP